MKKLLLVSTVSLLLVGCSNGEGENLGTSSVDSNFIKVVEGGEIDVYKDRETGCHYLHSDDEGGNATVGGFFPYYDESGKVKGCGETE